MLGEQYAAANLASSFELVVDFKPLKLYSRIISRAYIYLSTKICKSYQLLPKSYLDSPEFRTYLVGNTGFQIAPSLFQM